MVGEGAGPLSLLVRSDRQHRLQLTPGAGFLPGMLLSENSEC